MSTPRELPEGVNSLVMSRRIPVYATLVLAAFLVGRWFVDTQWIAETIQAVEAGHVASAAEAGNMATAAPAKLV